MKVLIAIDSFKGSMSSIEAGNAAQAGVKRVFPDADVSVCPLADGGEGTVEAVIEGMSGTFHSVKVSGPMENPVDCLYGILPSGKTAIMEMAKASGITLIPEGKKNIYEATTYGVGEVIVDAIKKGCRDFIVGIGGSATNDGGIGMLQALGFSFLDKDGKDIPHGPKGIESLHEIRTDTALPELSECRFRVACDVTNPLCGDLGASAVFGPQKGASPEDVKVLDNLLSKYAKLASSILPDTNPDYPGSGAAGGLGFAFNTFLNAKLESGIQIVLEELDFENKLTDVDYVITGEGRMDGQTAMGKAPVGVSHLARKKGIPVIGFAGGVTEDAVKCNEEGIEAFFPIVRGVTTLEEAMEPANAIKNMTNTVEQVFRLLSL